MDSVVLCFDLTNSYDASHTNNSVYFNMWVDGGYENAVVNQTIYFDQARNCEYIEVVYDLTPYVNTSAVLFYLNATSDYNDSHTFDVRFDNISIKAKEQTAGYSCDPFAGNDTSVCGLCIKMLTPEQHDSNTVNSWIVLSKPSATANTVFSNIATPKTDVCVNEYGVYEFILSGSNTDCSGYDTVQVEFLDEPIADAGNDFSECSNYAQMSATPSGNTEYWTLLTSGLTIVDIYDPATIIIPATYGTYCMIWHVENANCVSEDTVCVTFKDCVDVKTINKPFSIEFIQDNDNNILSIHADEFHFSNINIKIFSIDGKNIFNKNCHQLPLDIVMPKGLSLIVVRIGEQLVKKMMLF